MKKLPLTRKKKGGLLNYSHYDYERELDEAYSEFCTEMEKWRKEYQMSNEMREEKQKEHEHIMVKKELEIHRILQRLKSFNTTDNTEVTNPVSV